MFLKSLTLKGFKSFAEATTLEFEPGVTVVVGPNGSGKSNVVDAVAWVLGAQGPRALRSAKMEDVIFAGSSARPPLGRAEVSLTLDNTSGLLPIEFSEVTITRTLFRTGESEYAINRVPCRLLDIQELLSDSGVGRQQHVIVSQGNLDSVLNSRPEERRLIIEEAAGILKYRRRKEKSERRLESTEASLVRLQDLLREVRRQLKPLEKQAEAARRHGELVAELDALRRHLLGRELAAVEARLAGSEKVRTELSEAEEQIRHALARLDAQILAEETATSSTEQRTVEELSELVSRAEALRTRAGGMVALLHERRRSIERTLEAEVDFDVVASLEAEAAALRDRLRSTDEEAIGLMPAADDLAEAERALAEETRQVEERWHVGAPPARDAAAELRGELGGLRSAAERTRAELRRVDARVEALRQRSDRLDGEMSRLRQALDGAERDAPGLRSSLRAAREAEAAAERDLAVAASRLRHAEAEQHRWAARSEALSQALSQARARAGVEKLAGLEGVIGTLLELVEVEQGYEAAFEAAAGETLAGVVVEGPLAARRALERLRGSGEAGTVVALPLPGGYAPAGAAASSGAGDASGGSDTGITVTAETGDEIPAGVVKLRDKVKAWLPGVNALLDELLARVVVVADSWEEASEVFLAHPALVVVTRAGDCFAGRLWRSGSGGAGASAAALEEARQQERASSARAVEARAEYEMAERRVEEARREALAAARSLEACESARRSAEEGLRRLEHDLAEASSELEAARGHREDLSQRAERESARIAELESVLPDLERAAAAEAEKAAAERAARARLAERAAVVASMRRELEVRAAGLEERRTLTARRLEEVQERLSRLLTDRDDATSRREHLRKALELTAGLLATVEERERAMEQAVADLREARRSVSERIAARHERLEQLRRQRSAAERQLGEVRERASRVDLEETEARVRLEGLVEAIRRDLDCEPAAVRGADCPQLPPGTSPTSRRAELERELRLMGPINPLALDEHAALVERHDFLEAQLEDVRSARRELTKVIRAIDAEIVEVFRAAYADVADNFEKLFSTLFPGGQARLRLTDPERLLESGIEIEAMPSGKNVRRLSLLSGGERSLIALAFLFAVFRSRPSPFYMMDEVEAALDDLNLHRFLDLVQEFRHESQLLIVTHQKRTMEAADCLYGVSMAPGGWSKVVSERVSARVGR